jgi:hypothetical protein
MKELYNIQYKTDLEGYHAFDKKIADMFNRDNPSKQISMNGNISTTGKYFLGMNGLIGGLQSLQGNLGGVNA